MKPKKRLEELQKQLADIQEEIARLKASRVWNPGDIQAGLVIQIGSTGAIAIAILPYGYAVSDEPQRYFFGGLGGDPLEPFSDIYGGKTATEMAEYLNESGYPKSTRTLKVSF